jgi:hypothetical protein
MARNGIDIKHNLPSDKELARMFDAVPILDRHKVADKVLKAGAKPVVKRARQLAPRSTQADRDKRSDKQRGAADWDYPLWKTIAHVVRKYRTGGFAAIGPRWPKGNKAYFNTSPKGRRQVLWGKPTGRTLPQIRNWIVQAFDETKGQQLGAMKAKLKTVTNEIWRR